MQGASATDVPELRCCQPGRRVALDRRTLLLLLQQVSGNVQYGRPPVLAWAFCAAPSLIGRDSDGIRVALRICMMGQTKACRVLVHTMPVLVVSAILSGVTGGIAATSAFAGPLPAAQAAAATPISPGDLATAGQMSFKQVDVRRYLAARDPGDRSRWIDPVPSLPGRRWPFRADPRRWPRLFANTTECTLSFNPITRRHWWQRKSTQVRF